MHAAALSTRPGRLPVRRELQVAADQVRRARACAKAARTLCLGSLHTWITRQPEIVIASKVQRAKGSHPPVPPALLINTLLAGAG